MKILVTEQQLKNIDKSLEEQGIMTPMIPASVEKARGDGRTALDLAHEKYPCIPQKFVLSYQYLLEDQKYNEQFLKAALGIIGRESSFASGRRYNVMSLWKFFGSAIGGGHSVGPAQMSSDTAKDLGFNIIEISTATGALDAAYKYLGRLYKSGISVGYSGNQPSSMGANGTGNAALDIAIAAYNTGAGRAIAQWCKTSDPNICMKCSQITQGKKVLAPNYIPNFPTKRFDKVDTTTRGYVKEVAGWIRKMNC